MLGPLKPPGDCELFGFSKPGSCALFGGPEVLGDCEVFGDCGDCVALGACAAAGDCEVGALVVPPLGACPAGAVVGAAPEVGAVAEVGAAPDAGALEPALEFADGALFAAAGGLELGVADPFSPEPPLGGLAGPSGVGSGPGKPVSAEPEHPVSACIVARAEMT
jgi:hypothetical protein